MPLRTTLVASTTIVLTGLAWAGPARADEVAETEPYRICGPRGCYVHSTDGMIVWGSFGTIKGVAHDHGVGSTVVKIEAVDGDLIRRLPPILVDEADRVYTAGVGNVSQIDISVCNAANPGAFPCVKKTFRPD